MTEVLPAQITDAAAVDTWSHYVCDRVTPTPDPSEIVTPDQVIAELRNLAAAAGRMVMVVRDADVIRRDAGRVLAKAKARAQRTASEEGGRVADKEARVEELTEDEADAAGVADAAYEYARSVARLVDSQKSAVQTIARLVELQMSLAGSRRS